MIIYHSVVNGYGADDGRTFCCEPSPENAGISKGAEIHDRLCAHGHGPVHLLHLRVQIHAVSGGPKVHIDLRLQHGADAVGIQGLMDPVAGNGRPALCHPLTDLLRRPLLFSGHQLHFPGNDPLSGRVHLCCVIHIRSPSMIFEKEERNMKKRNLSQTDKFLQ